MYDVPRNVDPDNVPQTYEDIKAACLDSGSLWEDPDFPADDSSIYYNKPPSVWPDIEWKRPSEICDDPELYVDGASRLDVNQGILGDCWLLAAVASLATRPRLLQRVCPKDQTFSDDYAGIFRFELWQYGRWVEVIVDDRLPTHNGKLIYMHSDERNEFWSALLEKAYAKLCGCYETLSGGLTSEAMTDFTGGMVKAFSLQDQTPENLFKILLKANRRLSLMGCSINAHPDELEAELDNGLIIGHAYSVTDVRVVDTDDGPVELVRVRNPWGSEHEWKGPWSDDSDEWGGIDDDTKEAIGLTFEHDGEFWMSYEDFKDNFQKLEICYLGPDTLLDEDEGEYADWARRWEGQLLEGSWRRFVNAGGCPNFPKTFWTNPQYRVNIPEPDDDDDEECSSLLVGVMQKNRRKLRTEGKDNLTIGYCIYKLDDPGRSTLDRTFFARNRMVARSPNFINMREVSDHHRLPPGDYVIIPSTFECNEEADFILRIMSEKPEEMQEVDDDADDGDEPEEEELSEKTEQDEEKFVLGRDSFIERAGEDGEIDAYELRDLLNETFTQEFDFDGFSIDLCRSMVAMKDADLSGKLDFDDFQNLWSDLQLCQRAFRTLDADGDGYFNSYEFRYILSKIGTALGHKGMRISNSTFNAIVRRYGDREGHVHFDDFVASVIKLKTLFKTFREKDTNSDGNVTFGMDEFIQMTMYS